MWLGALNYTKKAFVGYNNDNALMELVKEELALLFIINGIFFIKNFGFFQNNIMVWVRLKNLPKGDIGLTNVYDPNNPWEHCTLWNKML
jgi:hypothetical protein